VTIPREVRAKFGLRELDILVFVNENRRLVLSKNVAD
jgi:bifunctional DNA-binding transcriptional regulator/antitoxin component of YhaV-PrlF toxin-antitoxin module